MRLRRLSSALLTIAGLLVAGSRLQAQVTLTWDGGGGAGNDILNAANWVTGTPVAGDHLIFPSTAPNSTVVLGTGNFTSGNLSFTGASLNYTIAGSGGPRVLTLGGNLTASHSAGSTTIFNGSVGLGLAAGVRTFNIGPADVVQVVGAISGAGSILKTNTGIFDIYGTNTYSGGTTVNGGQFRVNGASVSHAAVDTIVGQADGDDGILNILAGGTVSNNVGHLGLLDGAQGTATVDGAGSAWTNAGYLYVGEDGNGTLTVSNGGHVMSANTSVGNTSGGLGIVTVSGNGSSLDNSANLYVGSAGIGSLTLSGGATMTNVDSSVGNNSGGNGFVLVDTGSLWTNTGTLYVGASGTGVLDILSGGDVTANNVTISNVLSGDGTVNLSGVGSSLAVASILRVGSGGDGALDVANGASVTSGTGSVGDGFGTGDVAIHDGSIWNNTVTLISGNLGNGDTLIYAGGSVTAPNATIGALAGSHGSIRLEDAGSNFSTTGDLHVGQNGIGILEIQSGATASTGGQAIVGNNGPSTGAAFIHDTGSNWTVAGDIFVGNAGGGTLYVYDGGTVTSGGGTGSIRLGHTGGTGAINIGDNGDGTSAGGILNVAAVTTGTGTGSLRFVTTATKAAPYFFTQDGTLAGTPVQVTGGTQILQDDGYNILQGTNTYSGGTFVSGGTLDVRSAGALGSGAVTFTNNGTLSAGPGVVISNALIFSVGGTIGGPGTFGTAITIGTGMHLAPGSSPGTTSFAAGLTLAASGVYDFEVQSADGAPGVGYDLLSISGAPLDITATSGSRFTLKVISLNISGAAGNVSDFSSASGYTWTIATSAAGITNFAANKFTIDTTSFSNPLGTGAFYLTQSGNNLILNFSPVPEPSTYALMVAGLALAGLGYRRKLRRA